MLYQINEETKHKVKQFYITVHEDKYQIHLTATKCGEDWNVVIVGGERYHVGAVAIGTPGYIDGNKDRPTVTVNSFCVLGHKDDELARLVACELAKKLQTSVVVTVGIHIDCATTQEIGILCKTALMCCRKLEEQVKMKDWEIDKSDI